MPVENCFFSLEKQHTIPILHIPAGMPRTMSFHVYDANVVAQNHLELGPIKVAASSKHVGGVEDWLRKKVYKLEYCGVVFHILIISSR